MGHVLESLEGASDVFIVANRDYSEFGLPVYPDVITGGDSLSGLHSALVHAKFDWVAVAACDLPQLTPAYWAYMLDRAEGTTAKVVIAEGPGGWIEPLAAFYHKDLEFAARTQLKNGDYYLRRLTETAGAEIVAWKELLGLFGPQLFLNANTLEELRGASK